MQAALRKLWPFVGIALAVAVGMRLAPYIEWVALGAVLLACAGFLLGCAWIVWQRVARWWGRTVEWARTDAHIDP